MLDRLEERMLLSTADGNGPVVTGLYEQINQATGTASLVVDFDGPLNARLASNVADYQVTRVGPVDPEIVTRSGPATPIINASYSEFVERGAVVSSVALRLARPLAAGTFYRVWINGSPGSGLTGATGTLFDGDNDDTPGGDFYGLVAQGQSVKFSDMSGDRVKVWVTGGGQVAVWRELDGNVDALRVVGGVPGQTALNGTVTPARGSGGLVVIPTIQGLTGVTNNLASPPFVSQAPIVPASPTPVVATTQNLPYSLEITQVPLPSLPSIQSAVYAQANGLWLLFGGRTNGLHNFNPTGNFPPQDQNNDIIVIDPATGRTWIEPWSAVGIPASVAVSLSSSNQEFYQTGNQLYTVGGYSQNPITNQYQTYDSLTSINVSGLINAIVSGTSGAAFVRQARDPRLQVTGGEMAAIGGRTYLMMGQLYNGEYTFPPTATQVYSDEIRSFRIINTPRLLTIVNFQSQRDPVNFRRRDYNQDPFVFPNGQPGLAVYGGVFTVAGGAFLNPILIGPKGFARVDTNYQQFFTQYNAARVALFDSRSRTMDTILMGGISLYHYDFTTGTLSSDPDLPFDNDVTTLAWRANGSIQEYMMPSQLPGPPDLLGAEAAFFTSPGVPQFANGVIRLAQLHGPTTLGYLFGGIESMVAETSNPFTQTAASNMMFRVTLIPN